MSEYAEKFKAIQDDMKSIERSAWREGFALGIALSSFLVGTFLFMKNLQF